MASKSLKIGWIVLFIMGLFKVYIGVMLAFATQYVFVRSFEVFTAKAWTDLATDYPKMAEMFIMMGRLLGTILIASAILILFVVWNSYRKAHKWSWYALLFAGALGWGSALVYNIVIGYAPSMVNVIIGIILFVIGIAVPAKAILGGKAASG